jgi:RNA polymerase sigma factor (sigma-70 family)
LQPFELVTLEKYSNQVMKKELSFSNEPYLIAQLRAGNQKALAYLYKTHYQMIHHLIRKNNGGDEDAQEIYQEAILVVYEKLQQPNFELSCSLKTFIYSVSRNMWMYQLRKTEQALNKFKDFEQFIPIREEPEIDQHTPAYENMLTEVMQFLDTKCRELLELFYYHNLSLDVIAEKLGYNNSNTAKSKKSKCMERAREKARELLDKYED